MPIFCPKNVHYLGNTQLSCLYIFFKKRPFYQKQSGLIYFFSNLSLKNSLLSCAYLVKNTSILLKLYYIMGQKVNRMRILFFTILYKKIATLMRIFDKKRTFFQRKCSSHAHNFSENVHSLKNTTLSCQIVQIFMKNPLLPCPYLIKKRQFCQNNTIL